MHNRFAVIAQSRIFAYFLHHVEPITSSLCIRKTSFTGKTYYGKEVIVSRKGPCEMNILSLFLTFIIAVGVISNEKKKLQFH